LDQEVSREKSQIVGVRAMKSGKTDWSRIAHGNCKMFYENSRWMNLIMI